MTVQQKVFIDHAKEPLYTSTPTSYKPNLEKYEKEWIPKIKEYRDALKTAIPKEYLVPDYLIPENLDITPFDATSIPPKVLDKETLSIINLKAVEIAKKIASKELTAVQVLTAFIKSATIANQLTDCLLEAFFQDGLKRAKYLDDYYSNTGKLIGPLHGVPISLKEHYAFEGRVTHSGYVASLDNVTDKFSITNQILYDLGAVFYVRTDEPQSLMHIDSLNNISEGRCKNAHKTSLSPGGSSSGEGAIIGMQGSPLGVGSDIGGSIRAPAAFNGVYGLKPSTKRISMVGALSAATDTFQEGIGCVLGPLSNSIDDLELFMKCYVDSEPWLKDQHVIPLPWRDVTIPKPSDLTIGIVFDDQVVKPHPPVARAMKQVEARLKSSGVNVVTWEPHRVYEALNVVNGLYTADGNYAALNKFAESGEPLVPLTDYFLSVGKGEQGLSTLELQFYTNTREILRQEYLNLFNERGVDFVLAPTYVGTAPKPSTPKYWGYTSLWNLLDSSCVTFPSKIKGDKELDLKDLNYVARNPYEEYEYGLYDPESSDNMPIGLTLVGRRYTEEAILKAAKVIEDIL